MDRDGRDGLRSCTLFFRDRVPVALEALDVLVRASGRMGDESREPKGEGDTELAAEERLTGELSVAMADVEVTVDSCGMED